MKVDQLMMTTKQPIHQVFPFSNLPCKNTQDFVNFEKKINEENLKQQLKEYFINISSSPDLTKFVKEILRKLLTDECACPFSYTGQHGNIAVKDYVCIKVIEDSAMEKYNASSKSIVSKIIQSWFAYAKDRVKKKNKKSKSA